MVKEHASLRSCANPSTQVPAWFIGAHPPRAPLLLEQWDKLQQLQSQLTLAHAWTPERHDHHMLLRFLRARGWDVAKAQAMWLENMRWRQDGKVDSVLSWFHFHERDKFVSLYPHGMHKTDKQGRPVLVQQLGHVNPNKLKGVVSEERWRLWHIQEMERLLHVVFPACSAARGCHIDQVFSLIDVKGVGLTNLHSLKNMLTMFMAQDSANYPETLGQMAIVNAPKIFRMAWSSIQHMLSEDTVKKILFISEKELLEFIDEDSLMVAFGGKSKGELADDLGPWPPWSPQGAHYGLPPHYGRPAHYAVVTTGSTRALAVDVAHDLTPCHAGPKPAFSGKRSGLLVSPFLQACIGATADHDDDESVRAAGHSPADESRLDQHHHPHSALHSPTSSLQHSSHQQHASLHSPSSSRSQLLFPPSSPPRSKQQHPPSSPPRQPSSSTSQQHLAALQLQQQPPQPQQQQIPPLSHHVSAAGVHSHYASHSPPPPATSSTPQGLQHFAPSSPPLQSHVPPSYDFLSMAPHPHLRHPHHHQQHPGVVPFPPLPTDAQQHHTAAAEASSSLPQPPLLPPPPLPPSSHPAPAAARSATAAAHLHHHHHSSAAAGQPPHHQHHSTAVAGQAVHHHHHHSATAAGPTTSPPGSSLPSMPSPFLHHPLPSTSSSFQHHRSPSASSSFHKEGGGGGGGHPAHNIVVTSMTSCTSSDPCMELSEHLTTFRQESLMGCFSECASFQTCHSRGEFSPSSMSLDDFQSLMTQRPDDFRRHVGSLTDPYSTMHSTVSGTQDEVHLLAAVGGCGDTEAEGSPAAAAEHVRGRSEDGQAARRHTFSVDSLGGKGITSTAAAVAHRRQHSDQYSGTSAPSSHQRSLSSDNQQHHHHAAAVGIAAGRSSRRATGSLERVKSVNVPEALRSSSGAHLLGSPGADSPGDAAAAGGCCPGLSLGAHHHHHGGGSAALAAPLLVRPTPPKVGIVREDAEEAAAARPPPSAAGASPPLPRRVSSTAAEASAAERKGCLTMCGCVCM